MSDERVSQTNPTTATAAGVSVEHPSIVSTIKNVARERGATPEARAHAMKISGMPLEVVNRYFHQVEQEKK